MNNSWISEIFKNSRGIRQDCPLSALLFVLSVEIMALRIRNNKDFQIKIDEQTHSIKISQLADDTILYFKDTYKVRNEIETKRNETKRNETKSTKTKRNETKSTKWKRNKTKPTKAKRNQRKQNEIDWYEKKINKRKR